MEAQLVALYPDADAPLTDAARSAVARTTTADRAGLLPDQVRAAASGLRQPPAPGDLAFDGIDGRLGSVESDLEAADAAPTTAQVEVVDDAMAKLDAATTRWTAFKSGPLVQLNAELRRQGRKPVLVPTPDKLQVEAPDSGQDLP